MTEKQLPRCHCRNYGLGDIRPLHAVYEMRFVDDEDLEHGRIWFTEFESDGEQWRGLIITKDGRELERFSSRIAEWDNNGMWQRYLMNEIQIKLGIVWAGVSEYLNK